MTPRVRKAALTAHIISTVGWLGSVAAFLALAVAGLTSRPVETVRAAYIAAELITWGVIVPLSAVSVVTGLIQSLGTPWGLFRHYWVFIKLVLTVAAALLLLLHTQPISSVANAAATTTLSVDDLRPVRVQLIVDGALALVALIVTTVLSVFKPQGLTPYGFRRRVTEGAAADS